MMQKGKIMAITCEKMQKADAVAAYEIEKTVQDGWSLTVIESTFNFSSNICFVAKINGEIAAFCCFEKVLNTANLNALSTKAQHRRKGIAKALLQYAFEALKLEGVNNFQLEVRSENTAAIALYKNLGFLQNGMRKAFYSAPKDDALLMALSV